VIKDLENKKKENSDAITLLEKAASLIKERAQERDMPEGERSMLKCVTAFNAMTGYNLTEMDGWLFMQYLKHARSRAGGFRQDDYEDDIAYSALRAEAAIKENVK
jgi:hypothetical protein